LRSAAAWPRPETRRAVCLIRSLSFFFGCLVRTSVALFFRKLQEAGPKRKKKLSQVIRDEWDELQNENRLLKKLKQGKISKKEFEIAVGERKKNGKERGVGGSDDDDGSDFDSDMGSDSDDEAPPKKKAKTAPAAGKGQQQAKGKQTAAAASRKKGKQAAAASESDMSDVSDDDE
jgi:hypothetical protein